MTASNSSEPVEQTAIETASPVETVQDKAPETQQATPEQEADPNTPAAAAPPAFTPDWKFKAFGKEYEIDELYRAVVKDEDTFKKVKDLHTKAYALDDYKSRYEGTQQEFGNLLNEYSSLDKDVKRVMKYRNDGDLENFLKAVRITDEQVLKYAEDKIRRMQMPPEQQQAFEQQALLRQQQYESGLEKQELEKAMYEQAVQVRAMQLENVMAKPEWSQAASKWDTLSGKEGAFRDLVIEEGQRAYLTTGQDITPEQAISLVVQKYGNLINQGQMPQAQAPGVAAPQATAQNKPVIPTVAGKGTSPVKKVPKSLDDLRAMSKDLGVGAY